MSVTGGPLCVICDHPLDSHSDGGTGGCTATVGRGEDGSLIRCDCVMGVEPIRIGRDDGSGGGDG